MEAYNYIELTGTIVPDAIAIRAKVVQEYKDLFGQDLVVTPNTPQGLLITAETAARVGLVRNNAALANQINPNLAGGTFLDGIWALTGGQRTPNVFSVVPDVDLAGEAGTIIPQGSQIKTATNIIFESLSLVTLNLSGEGTSDFQAILPGEINISPNQLNIIVTEILGWETANNTQSAIPGTLTQSDESARYYRRNELALQGQSTSEAIISRVNAIPGVRSLSYRENKTSATATIDGILMVPHSIYACIDGGSDSVIAETLQTAKEAGSDYNGSVTVNYTDPNSGQVVLVQFDRPDLIPVLCRVTVDQRSLSSVADPVGTIIGSILAYANGLLNNETGLRVGINVSPFEFSGAINVVAPSIFVKKVEVAYVAGSPVYVTTELAVALSEKATINDSSIIVIVV